MAKVGCVDKIEKVSREAAMEQPPSLTTSEERQQQELKRRVVDAERFYRYFTLVESSSGSCHRVVSILILVISSFSALALFSAIELIAAFQPLVCFRVGIVRGCNDGLDVCGKPTEDRGACKSGM